MASPLVLGRHETADSGSQRAILWWSSVSFSIPGLAQHVVGSVSQSLLILGQLLTSIERAAAEPQLLMGVRSPADQYQLTEIARAVTGGEQYGSTAWGTRRESEARQSAVTTERTLHPEDGRAFPPPRLV